MKTSGLIQVGWASAQCNFDPEGGTGVGDDDHSYAYDGVRRKKWHGTSLFNNRYGERWDVGTVVTTTIDLYKGEIGYYHNGKFLGVAFEDVPTEVTWYPVINIV